MSMRLWVCRRLIKHIEWLERSIPEYIAKLNKNLKLLEADEFFILTMEYGGKIPHREKGMAKAKMDELLG